MFIRDLEVLKALLVKLNDKAQEGCIVLEGKKDLAALKKLGVKADFFILNEIRGANFGNAKISQPDFCINKGKSLYEEAEMLAKTHSKSLLMLDADKKGQELSRVFKSYLQKNGVQVDTNFGRMLLKAFNCRRVEELAL